MEESVGNPATLRRSTESAGNPKRRETPAMWRRPTKSAGNPAIQRRSKTREIEGSTKIEQTIDTGLNDAIDEVVSSARDLRTTGDEVSVLAAYMHCRLRPVSASFLPSSIQVDCGE